MRYMFDLYFLIQALQKNTTSVFMFDMCVGADFVHREQPVMSQCGGDSCDVDDDCGTEQSVLLC